MVLVSIDCRLSEAVDVTIECDVHCVSDVSEKYQSVLQSSPDYDAVASSLQELNYCNNLCVSISECRVFVVCQSLVLFISFQLQEFESEYTFYFLIHLSRCYVWWLSGKSSKYVIMYRRVVVIV